MEPKRMKGLEPSTFCMATTMRELTAAATSRQTAWLRGRVYRESD